MKKLSVQVYLVFMLIAFATAQSNKRNRRKSSSTRSQPNDETIGQGRTLNLIRPLLGLGLSSIARPLLGYDVSFANRPSAGSGLSQSDPYYGYGNYGGYNSYNYYGGHPLYRPTFPIYNAYRPLVYPAYFGGYPQYNGFGGQRPAYSSFRPRPIAQRPVAGQQPATYPSISPASPAASGTTTPVANSAQAAQIANLLGQLLGQQLRPLLNQEAASPAHDEPAIAQHKYYRNRLL